MGALACLLSAVGFGLLAVFAKLSYDDGVQLDALLLVRFGLSGILLTLVAGASGRFRGLSRGAVVTALLMGAVGYNAQSGLYLSALTRVDASQVTLVFSLYPLLVMVVAVLTRRERASWRRGSALVVALGGVALVLGGAAAGAFEPLGAALALGAAVVYTGYILVGDRVRGVDAVAFAALVCVGATGGLVLWSVVRGAPALGFAPQGWLWLALLAVVSTVAPIILFLAGLARVGPSVAALLSVLEPVVTVTSAALVFGEALTSTQAVGGVLVLGAVAVLQWPGRSMRWRKVAAPAVA
jgi:drug/metabolite transporter (DMT)-like permease